MSHELVYPQIPPRIAASMISRAASLLRSPVARSLCAGALRSYKTIAEVKSMPDFHWQMSNDMIITLAMLGDQV